MSRMKVKRWRVGMNVVALVFGETALTMRMRRVGRGRQVVARWTLEDHLCIFSVCLVFFFKKDFVSVVDNCGGCDDTNLLSSLSSSG